MAIISVIKFNGNENELIWKFPNEEIATWSQLIVNETQEVLFLKDGKICDLFTAGKYTLDTENIPLLNTFINLPFGSASPFKAEVWFINKLSNLNIAWGTPSPIQIQDPKYKIYISLRSFGQFGIKIIDSTLFFKKLVGTNGRLTAQSLNNYFKGIYLTKVKDTISSYLVNRNIGILEINAYLEELSQYITKKINPIFNEYGVELINFYVNDINFPDDDESVIILKNALAKKAEMDIVGYNYTQERSFNTLEGAATNPGSGMANNFIGAGIGVSLGSNIGNALSNDILPQMDTTSTKKIEVEKLCSNCGEKNDFEQKYCQHCGHEQFKKCRSCGAVQKNTTAKFCCDCGQSLIKKCTECSTLLEKNMKFCPNCSIEVK